MDSNRQLKVAKLLQKEIAAIILRESKNYSSTGMITVTRVRVTRDLGLSRIQLSFFGVPNKEDALKKIRENSWAIRKSLGAMIRNQVRIIPELTFFDDDSLDYIENIDNLLKL